LRENLFRIKQSRVVCSIRIALSQDKSKKSEVSSFWAEVSTVDSDHTYAVSSDIYVANELLLKINRKTKKIIKNFFECEIIVMFPF
jgi:hypothetical protein